MKAKRRAKDRISTLPQNIIETILCHLHIRDAVRTSVLSKNWRYGWTRIPKLVFVENTFEKVTGRDQLSVMERDTVIQSPGKWMLKSCKFLYAIFQVLLFHQGPILQLTLDMDAAEGCFEINQIILHLTRSNTVTELKILLDTNGADAYMLPLSIYSLHQLTDLHLRDCSIDHQPPVDGFGRLTTLCLEEVRIVYAETLLHLLSKSPLLRRVTLLYYLHDEDYIPFLELFKNLRLIEHLTTSVALFNMCLIKNAVPEKLPTSLVHLRYLHLKDTSFTNNNGLSCLALLIKSSPNLEKIYLQNEQIYRREWYTEKDSETDPVTLEEYSNIWLEHLYELKIQIFCQPENWIGVCEDNLGQVTCSKEGENSPL